MGHLRGHVIDAKGVVAVWLPTFAAKAVRAAKAKVVSQPRLVKSVVCITMRSVPSLEGLGGILQHARCGFGARIIHPRTRWLPSPAHGRVRAVGRRRARTLWRAPPAAPAS